VNGDYDALWAGPGKSEGRARGPIQIAMGSERGNPPAATVIQDAMHSPGAFLPKKQRQARGLGRAEW
jgi:hypothetical protein